jgi:ActR/RegA family two-component response regulator
MIIGFELERTLEQLGYENISLAANVSEALKSIDSASPSFAILDINLGAESSEAVADRLSSMKIPFIFATGYSAISDDFKKKFTNTPIVEKPYGSASIKAALSLVIK